MAISTDKQRIYALQKIDGNRLVSLLYFSNFSTVEDHKNAQEPLTFKIPTFATAVVIHIYCHIDDT